MLRLNGIKSLTVEARSNVLQAAGYTTRRYVKLLRRSVEAPFPVCPARSSRRQEGVLLQGHPLLDFVGEGGGGTGSVVVLTIIAIFVEN